MSKRAAHLPDVIVVGAGAAGLAAAQVLSSKGCAVTVLEARQRIGGRIWTIREAGLPIPVEMGAEFIHGTPQSTLQLVQDAGLIPYRILFEHMERRGGRLMEIPGYAEELKRALAGLARISRRDMSLADYLRQRAHGKKLTRAQRLAVDFAEGFDAADPERISAKSLAEEQAGVGDLDEEPQFRLLGGYGPLMEHLHSSLRAGRVKMRLGRVVSEIEWSKGKAEVRCGDSGEVFRAPRVLITLPLGVLQLPPESPGSVRFIPEIAAKRHPLSLLASGPIVKVVIHFHRDFWESLRDEMENASFIHGPELPFPTWWTAQPLRLPLLTGWAGGPKALHLTGRGTNGLRDAAVGSLARLLGRGKPAISAGIAGFHGCDWPADPFARGAYSYVTVGGSQARRELAKPVARTIFFAGEATDTSGQASTVAGALSSGQRAGRVIVASL